MTFLLALLALPAVIVTAAVPSAAGTVQVTSSAPPAMPCTSAAVVADEDGSVLAWQSDCVAGEDNVDGSLEIVRATGGSAGVPITDGEDCTSRRPGISADGERVAFESDCDLTGDNDDGNAEIFLWDAGSLRQLTDSFGCDNLAPSISGDGRFVAFDSTCNNQGTNNNGHGSEVFRFAVSSGNLRQLTDSKDADCDSTSPSISHDGGLVAFDSDCDLAGQNPDRAIEIFTVTGDKTVAQQTFAADDACASVRPSIDAAGAVIAFHGNCSFDDSNADRGDEVFTVDTATRTVRAVTDSTGQASCASGEARIARSGKAVAWTGYCKVGGNGDGSIEVFQRTVGASTGAATAVTVGAAPCSSVAGALSGEGGRVFLDSDCDLAVDNADGSIEVFRADACRCGAPATRQASPVASDSQLALRAAVGSASCLGCECDTNDDGSVSASDALRILKAAVGQAGIQLDCPPAS